MTDEDIATFISEQCQESGVDPASLFAALLGQFAGFHRMLTFLQQKPKEEQQRQLAEKTLMAEIEGTYQSFAGIPATQVEGPLGLPPSFLGYLRDATRMQVMLATKDLESAVERLAEASANSREIFRNDFEAAERKLHLYKAVAMVLGAVLNACERSAIEASVRPPLF